MNQTEDKILGLEDKVENLDKISKYEKLKKTTTHTHRKVTYRKYGTP